MGKVPMGLLHTCEVCSSSFARKGDLTRHSYIHEDIKPYKCKVCGKGFSQSSGLNTHMNTHSGNKPYWCSFGCASRFGDPSSCARHEKEIHRRVVPYRCPDPYCSSRIKRRSSFADHLKSKHGIDADVVDIDAFAPPLLPALEKHRKPRGKSLKLITDTSTMDECKEQPFDHSGGLSSACSETPSPVNTLPRSSNLLDNLQVPLYSDIFDDFFESKPFCPLDSLEFPTDQFLLQPTCAPHSHSTSVKSGPLQTPSVGLSLDAPQHAKSTATRDVAFELNFLPFGLRGRIDLSDYSSMKSWS